MDDEIKVDNFAIKHGDECGIVYYWDCPECGESLNNSDWCGHTMMCKCGIWEFEITATLER